MKKLLIIALLLLPAMLFANGANEATAVKTVTLWHSNTGLIGEAFDEIVENYNNGQGKKDGIVIEAVFQGKANDVLTKVKAALTSQEGLPDIAQMDATAGLDMKNCDKIVTLEENGVNTADVMEQALGAFKTAKGTIAMPFNCSALLFYYNKTAFDKAGISVPKTLDEFTATASKLVEKNNGEITRYAFAGVPTTYELGTFIGSQKGLSYTVDGKNGHDGDPKNVVFDKEGTFKNFLTKWKALYDTGAVANLTSGITTEFAAGRVCSMLASSSNISTILSTVDGQFEVGAAFVPKVDEEATGGVNIGGGGMYAFSKDEATRKVLEYLSGKDAQRIWSEKTGYLAINKEAQKSEEYQTFLAKNPIYQVPMEEVLASNPLVTGTWMPSGYQIYYSFQSEIRNVTEKNKDIDQTVKDMSATIQQALDEYARQNLN